MNKNSTNIYNLLTEWLDEVTSMTDRTSQKFTSKNYMLKLNVNFWKWISGKKPVGM